MTMLVTSAASFCSAADVSLLSSLEELNVQKVVFPAYALIYSLATASH